MYMAISEKITIIYINKDNYTWYIKSSHRSRKKYKQSKGRQAKGKQLIEKEINGKKAQPQ